MAAHKKNETTMTWLDWEIEILNDLVGQVSSGQVLQRINTRRKSQGLAPRTYASLAIKCGRMGLKLRAFATDQQTVGAWAQELGIEVEKIRKLVYARYPLKTKRQRNGNAPICFSRQDIDTFLAEYPNLAAQCNHEMLQALKMPKAIARLQLLNDRHIPTRGRRVIRRVDTGETFPTIALAAEATFQHRITIHRSLKDGKPRNGIGWEYVND